MKIIYTHINKRIDDHEDCQFVEFDVACGKYDSYYHLYFRVICDFYQDCKKEGLEETCKKILQVYNDQKEFALGEIDFSEYDKIILGDQKL